MIRSRYQRLAGGASSSQDESCARKRRRIKQPGRLVQAEEKHEQAEKEAEQDEGGGLRAASSGRLPDGPGLAEARSTKAGHYS